MNKYICLVCNKILETNGEALLHNYGDHTTGKLNDANSVESEVENGI